MTAGGDLRIERVVQGPLALRSLELVFGDLRQANRHLEVQSLLVDELPLEGLLVALRDGALVGAVLAITQPGGAGLVWPPRLVEGEAAGTADRLMEAVEGVWATASVVLACSALETVGAADDALLRTHGYALLSTVLYLISPRGGFPPTPPVDRLEFEPHSEANHGRLVSLVRATYEATQDCAGLRDPRDIGQVLAGYRQTGRYDPRHWLVVRHQGRDVGCLIVADHLEHGSCELVYMGLIPSARGHGWGKEIARYAQWLTSLAGRDRLVLAVDAANDPAVAVYTSVGFRAWERRVVYANHRANSFSTDCREP
jgi:mycothiol synthase